MTSTTAIIMEARDVMKASGHEEIADNLLRIGSTTTRIRQELRDFEKIFHVAFTAEPDLLASANQALQHLIELAESPPTM